MTLLPPGPGASQTLRTYLLRRGLAGAVMNLDRTMLRERAESMAGAPAVPERRSRQRSSDPLVDVVPLAREPSR